MEVIKDSYIVKNAVLLLGGRRRKGEEKDGKEGAEAGEGEGRKEVGRKMEWEEMGVGEKTSLIELLIELVKGGVKIGEEEELKEVLLELEEEGSVHVEEEMDLEGEETGEEKGRGGKKREEKEEEKKEWEELSERAYMLVRMMEKMKSRREGKRSATLMKIRKEREEIEKGREEEKKRADQEKKKREEAEAAIEKMRLEMEKMRKDGTLHSPPLSNTPTTQIVSSVITSLDGTSVTFPQSDGIKRDENTIIHPGSTNLYRNCFIGGVMTSVYFIILFFSSSLLFFKLNSEGIYRMFDFSLSFLISHLFFRLSKRLHTLSEG